MRGNAVVMGLWLCYLSVICTGKPTSSFEKESTWEDETMIRSLPDANPPIPANSMYGGYLNVSGRHYYYIFVRAQEDPDNAPFLMWTNGGPGCSSVGEGLWMEHGPYQVSNSHAGVEANPYSWNRVANILYLEHPVGVGFSYSEDPSDYKRLNDFSEADDLYLALGAFMARYPGFAPGPDKGMYLSGESYGGEYVPHLAHKIVFGPSIELRQALRGFVILNPELNCDADKSGYSATLQYQLYFHHGLMSYRQFHKWDQHSCAQGTNALSKPCQSLLAEAESAVGTVDQQLLRRARFQRAWRSEEVIMASAQEGVEANFDPDHKYQSFCLANSTLEFANKPNGDSAVCHPLGDPGRMSQYLNRPDVQAALHVRSDKMASPTWSACAGDWINYDISGVGVLKAYIEPIFNVTTNTSFRILVVSGDEDIATCPGPITQACLSELTLDGAEPLKQLVSWKPWTHSENGVTAGYYEVFERYMFATVKGAGHTVPQYQPATTFQLFSSWLAGASF